MLENDCMAYTPAPPELIFKGRVAYVTHAYVPLSKPDSHSLSLRLSVCLSLLHAQPHTSTQAVGCLCGCQGFLKTFDGWEREFMIQ